VTEKKVVKAEGKCLPCDNIQSRDWYSWLNLMPPPPDEFHVVGEIYVPNPGVDPLLAPRHPQGINPEILLLDLHLRQQPGNWPQTLVWRSARYDKVGPRTKYARVQVFCDEKVVADMKVEEVH